MTRAATSRYVDPLDAIWLGAAARVGLHVRRSAEAYASTDGRGALAIAPREALDADDCLAQIILHELCHGLVQGEGSFARPDWGLGNDEHGASYGEDAVDEHACLRTQAALLVRHGLRRFLAPTTDFRAYYDALPPNPLDGDAADRSIPLARAALGRAARPPFAGVLAAALRATAAIHRIAAETPMDASGPLPLLYRAAPPAPLHPTGLPMPEPPPSHGPTCGDCAWAFSSRGSLRCRRTENRGRAVRVNPAWPACALREAPLLCQPCAACCRHAFDLVPLSHRDRAALRHPDLIQSDGRRLSLRRDPAGSCAALCGPKEGPYACVIYEDRPRTCRDFELGSTNCLEARRRVGLSI